MVRNAKVVIGAGYGDEGKGATVDRLVEGEETLVVRFNGGGQAGHTVQEADGRKHIFHHVGAGAFKGAGTFLSRFFVSNPMVLAQELDDLKKLGLAPRIFADRRGLLTTPYDMLINQIVEVTRGGGRHGSCGIGFGETIERAERGFSLTVEDLHSLNLRSRLKNMRDFWVPRRLAALGVDVVPEDYRDLLESEDLLDAYLNVTSAIATTIEIGADERLRTATDVVFEGAQGLLLDQDRGDFPFVTRSNTGLKNVLALCNDTGISEIETFYATRCYVTRHGAGPLPGQLEDAPFASIVDETNIPNAWQGTLRFAHLDFDRLLETVISDLSDVFGSSVTVTPRFAINCLDQAPAQLPVIQDRKLADVAVEDILDMLNAKAGFSGGMEGWGPNQNDFRSAPAIDRAA